VARVPASPLPAKSSNVDPAGPLMPGMAPAIIVPSYSDSVHMVIPLVPAWHAAHVTAFAVLRLAGEPWPC